MTKVPDIDLSMQDRWLENNRIREYEAEERRKALLLEREGPDYDPTLGYGEEFKFTHEERPVKVKSQKKPEPKSDPIITWSVIMTALVASMIIYIFASMGV
jgi:hypothetical protein